MSMSSIFRPTLTKTGQLIFSLLVAWMIAITISPVVYADGTTLPKAAAPTFSPAPGSFTSPQAVTISSTQAGVLIYFTTDGTVPTTSSTLYKSPVDVAKSIKLSAIAVYPNRLSPSDSASGYYVINVQQQKAPMPVFSPAPGTFTAPTQVTISLGSNGTNTGTINTPTGTIYYTTDGKVPTSASTKYTGPITVSTTTKITAVTYTDKLLPSDPAIGYYVISSLQQKAPMPVFSPAPGTFTAPKQVTISLGSNGTNTGTINAPTGTIYYTTDGKVPTSASTKYTGPITVSTTTKITAVTFMDKMLPSEPAMGNYVIAVIQKVATPAFTVAPGTFTTPPTVGITCATPDAVIRYTSNGTVPTSTSPLYTTPAVMTKTTTLTVKAFKSGMLESEALTGTFTISAPVVTQGVDLMIKTDPTSKSIGEGIIDLQGTQVASKTAAARRIASYIIAIKNTGNAVDYYSVKGVGSKVGWSVNFIDAIGLNVTQQVTSGTGLLVPQVLPGKVAYLRLDVTPLSSTLNDNSIDVVITATSKLDSTKADQVKATTTKTK